MPRGHLIYGTAPIDLYHLQNRGSRQALACVLTRMLTHDDSFLSARFCNAPINVNPVVGGGGGGVGGQRGWGFEKF